MVLFIPHCVAESCGSLLFICQSCLFSLSAIVLQRAMEVLIDILLSHVLFKTLTFGGLKCLYLLCCLHLYQDVFFVSFEHIVVKQPKIGG